MVSLVILAAGLSTRFPGNKILAEIRGVPIIVRLVKEALRSKVDEVLVVTGHDAAKVEAALSGLTCRIVRNEEYLEGQSSSLKKGVREASHSTDAVMILPGDVALVRRVEIDKVVEVYGKNRKPIVVASHKGRLGHPILFDRSLIPEILRTSEKGEGLKEVVNRHRKEILKVEAGSNRVLVDVDTKADYEKYMSSTG